MITVIADDITGAAELAGIALRFGQRVGLITTFTDSLPECDILIYASDTRSMTKEDAIAETGKVIRYLQEKGYTDFFKKTDSALRGYIIDELNTMLSEIGWERALLIPQNPSKGRIITNGFYYIDDKLIEDSSFAYDPEFPSKSSDVKEILGGAVEVINPSDKIKSNGITVVNASSQADIRTSLNNSSNKTLLAGAADLFKAYLKSLGLKENQDLSDFKGICDKKTILVCGSTVNHSLFDNPFFKNEQVSVCQMPKRVFEGGDTLEWYSSIQKEYKLKRLIALWIGYPSKGGKDFAVRLRNTMSEAVENLVKTEIPQELIIEGGATAFAILNALEWNNFTIENEIAPGIIRMSLTTNTDIHVTLKPGSYPWNDKLFL